MEINGGSKTPEQERISKLIEKLDGVEKINRILSSELDAERKAQSDLGEKLVDDIKKAEKARIHLSEKPKKQLEKIESLEESLEELITENMEIKRKLEELQNLGNLIQKIVPKKNQNYRQKIIFGC